MQASRQGGSQAGKTCLCLCVNLVKLEVGGEHNQPHTRSILQRTCKQSEFNQQN